MSTKKHNAKQTSIGTKRKQIDIPSKLEDALQAVQALKSTIDEEAEVLQEERATFEVMRKKLGSVHFKKHVKLNVGGQIFKTSLETLVKDPDSMLAAMFSERFDVKPDEEDGAYFIDRDGTHFRYILNYLRTGKLIYPNENKILANELYIEAEFYQLDGVQKEIWPGASFQNSHYIINSLTEEQKNALLSWLPFQDIFFNWVQIYSSSVNGYDSSYFHQDCDNKGPTVIIAKAGNNIFGGYAEVSWNSSSSFVKDENAFLFTLANPTGARPTKLPQSDNSGGIWCDPSYGPGFGSANGTNIWFMDCPNGPSYCSVNNSNTAFQIPQDQPFTNFIYGSNTTAFGTDYIEVFCLKKT
ncbi:uncharacterized protein LOC114531501 [Dendronephthya gigantea]|uniref:uncharacterized protein LOC114531501 n=1 Tax=Dendronephthya gigantea TaxID=151771 RepID=UPI0010692AF2|nr:uncharacterized protein LOC114531501 [Dendronephthya gigantea]